MIENKVLSGYCYHYQTTFRDGMIPEGMRRTSVMMNRGATIKLIQSLRETGMSDQEIGSLITVWTDDFTKICLNDLAVTKKDLEKPEK